MNLQFCEPVLPDTDWNKIYQKVIDNAEEVEYDTDLATFESVSEEVGWNYHRECAIEREYLCVDNYDALVKNWEEQIRSALREAIDGIVLPEEVSKEELLGDMETLVELYQDKYPLPREEVINEKASQNRKEEYEFVTW